MTEAYLEELRDRVRSDRRAVTAPLLTFGALVVAHVLLAAAVSAATESAMATHLTALVYWPLAGALGLFALWQHARHVAARDGVGEGPRSYRPITIGYVVSVPLLAILFVPVLFVGVFAPLVWPAAVLYAVALKQHTRELRTVAKVLAFVGCLGGLAALSGNPWLFSGVELVGGLALLAWGLARR
ncbi:hypothetical protein [Cryptosporangium arvum]|jgi:hypothetical protein|uniref:hypothetical protein n=1 Tax=Cryptosporangium arvum TaxID=80871 RepID=UPI0004B11AE1|nr:hypothetical protein [Cryptosporangium arvum]